MASVAVAGVAREGVDEIKDVDEITSRGQTERRPSARPRHSAEAKAPRGQGGPNCRRGDVGWGKERPWSGWEQGTGEAVGGSEGPGVFMSGFWPGLD